MAFSTKYVPFFFSKQAIINSETSTCNLTYHLIGGLEVSTSKAIHCIFLFIGFTDKVLFYNIIVQVMVCNSGALTF